MDEENERIVKLADVLLKCHGKQAMGVARRRANRCRQLDQLDWSQSWSTVAERLARSSPSPIRDEPQTNGTVRLLPRNRGTIATR